MVTFEGYERRIDKINACMKKYGIKDLEDAKSICSSKGIDVESIVKGTRKQQRQGGKCSFYSSTYRDDCRCRFRWRINS